MNKKDLSKRAICTKFIAPKIEAAGWDIQNQVREDATEQDRTIGKEFVAIMRKHLRINT